jgi:hypothetical protein
MDFTSEIMIDFGLNLAGYLIVALMIYLLTGRRLKSVPASEEQFEAAVASTNGSKVKANPSLKASGALPEFIPLNQGAVEESPERKVTDSRIGQTASLTAADRKENRRAIYQEARRLLAAGRPRDDLLEHLPLTEGELEMLSVGGKA